VGLEYLHKSADIARQINKCDVLIVTLRKILNSFSVRQSTVRGKFIALGLCISYFNATCLNNIYTLSANICHIVIQNSCV
jgi:hypothetical protein